MNLKLLHYKKRLNGLSDEYRRFVNWCYDHKRNIAQIFEDKYTTSLELWQKFEARTD